MNPHRHFVIITLCIICSAIGLSQTRQNIGRQSNSEHLVVLSHGIMGTSKDLEYLAQLIEEKGCMVLMSKANEKLKSLHGIKAGGERLASEIQAYLKQSSSPIKRLSIVGNSLGGLYMRYAMHIMYNESEGTIAGLIPHKFLTIATPHLGVRNWNYLEEAGIPIPDVLKVLVSKVMLASGRDVFMVDNGGPGGKAGAGSWGSDGNNGALLYRLATEEKFLKATRAFRKRRLYANLQRDFVVPLGTAAFLDRRTVDSLREKYSHQKGIVTTLKPDSEECHSSSGQAGDSASTPISTGGAGSSNRSTKYTTSPEMAAMISGLDSLGWEKVIVNFPGLLPLAHNKICALTRSPKVLYNDVLGFSEGRFVMENASEWLTDTHYNEE